VIDFLLSEQAAPTPGPIYQTVMDESVKWYLAGAFTDAQADTWFRQMFTPTLTVARVVSGDSTLVSSGSGEQYGRHKTLAWRPVTSADSRERQSPRRHSMLHQRGPGHSTRRARDTSPRYAYTSDLRMNARRRNSRTKSGSAQTDHFLPVRDSGD
jgi:hypothetical protein